MTSVTFHHTPTQWHNPLPGWVEQHHLHTITNPSHADRLSSSRTLLVISTQRHAVSVYTTKCTSSQQTHNLALLWDQVKSYNVIAKDPVSTVLWFT